MIINTAFELEEKYTGESVESKLGRIREEMKKAGTTAHVLTTLDDICWTLNIRGNDIDFFPLVLSYMVITMDKADLYVDENKFSAELRGKLEKDGVVFHPYNAIYEDIKSVNAEASLLIDPVRLNYALYNNIPENVKKVEARNPEILFKCLKNKVEIENIRKAQIKDSVAHVRFMKWLKENVGKMTITEMSASDKLDEFRVEMGNFIRPSFGPISSYGAHSAMCHYSSTPETNVELKEGELFLTDTGAGFYEGSTDITRTYALGEVPQFMKDHFTLVAMSNLRLANAKFLKGCTGMNLDVLARQPFWERGLNFNHGTGHGVGYLLNVHERPIGIRYRVVPERQENTPFMPGMVCSDEPGIYIEGSHGIRTENLIYCKKDEKTDYGQFLSFEYLTYVPIDLEPVDASLMEEQDLAWLNEYHAQVYEKIAPYLDTEEAAWLKEVTRPLSK